MEPSLLKSEKTCFNCDVARDGHGQSKQRDERVGERVHERERDGVLAGVPPFTVEGRVGEIERLQPVPFKGRRRSDVERSKRTRHRVPSVPTQRLREALKVSLRPRWFRPCPGVPREVRRSLGYSVDQKEGFSGLSVPLTP
ncbi:uncharacterized protein HKW66_Vig0209060 [Vigna angularis]|uniref:Uncharacterized protein n=1 Tax=Phaseolus angularis TaxID=3914 RepID=A0A8T0JGB9_PHAAN|nr:uncharacterized protein HKW66_Vig0209060 [Vigna angularis]